MNTSTICALATPVGGAISIIRISGSQAIAIADTIFSKDISNAHAGRVIYGNIISADGTIIDDVLLTIFRAPHSYTGEDSIEISCHGSRFITQTILDLLITNGCTMAAPGEYTQRAFLNGKMDLSQAEAVADLIASSNAASHRVALNQMRGAFNNELTVLHDKLIELSSLLELELDFSEEDIQFADRQKLISVCWSIEEKIQRMIDSFRLGNVLKNGIPVAIIGAPNVGKSTLLNQLLHDDKAIVSSIEGTTRDIVEDCVQIGDYTFRFLDTAGIRNTSDTIEMIGIERSLKAAQQAQIIILLTEPCIPYPTFAGSKDQTVIHVINKSDLPNYVFKNNYDANTIFISALTGEGISQLEQRLLSTVPDYDSSEIIVTSQRHVDSLKQALSYMQQLHLAIEHALPTDLAAEDLKSVINALSTILGKSIQDPETTLRSIFSHFCIGK